MKQYKRRLCFLCTICILSIALHAQPYRLVVPTGHNNEIFELQASPDHRYLASFAFNGEIKIWDINVKKELMTFSDIRSSHPVSAMAFSPDNKLFAAGSLGGSFYLWSVNGQHKLQDFLLHGGGVKALHFSPDGKKIAIAYDTTLYVYSVDGDTIISRAPLKNAGYKIRFLTDGNTIALLDNDSGTNGLFYFDVRQNDFTEDGFTYRHGGIEDFEISKDGQYIYNIVHTDSGQIRVHKIGAEDTLRMPGHAPTMVPYYIATTDSAHIIFTHAAGEIQGEQYKTRREIKRWDLNKKVCTDSIIINSNEMRVCNIFYQPSTGKILTRHKFMGIAAYAPGTASSPDIFPGFSRNIVDVYFDKPGSFITTTNVGQVFSNNLSSSEVVRRLHKEPLSGVIYSGFEPSRPSIIFYNQASPRVLKRINLSTSAIDTFFKSNTVLDHVNIYKDKAVILRNARGNDERLKQIIVFDLKSGKAVKDTFCNCGQPRLTEIEGIVFFPDDNYDTVFAWNYAKSKLIKLRGAQRRGSVKDVLPIGNNLVATTHSGMRGFMVWDYDKGSFVRKVESGDDFYEKLLPGKKKEHLLVADYQGRFRKFDLKSLEPKSLFLHSGASIQHWGTTPEKDGIYTYGNDYVVKFWDLNAGKMTHEFVPLDSSGYFIRNSQGYYRASRDAAKLLYYVTPDLKIVTFDQLDIRYNRPDKVLASLGNADTTLVRSFHHAYQKRIRRMNVDTSFFSGLQSVPMADFKQREKISFSQQNAQLALEIRGSDSIYALERFNIWVNEVPLFGREGINLRSHHRNFFDTMVTITLSQGDNRIETSVTNLGGIESYRVPLYVNYTPPVKKETKVHFIGIGVNRYLDSAYNLQWSVNDIKKLAAKLKEKYANLVVDTIFDASVTAERVAALKERTKSLGEDDILIVSYSGHGLLSKQFDYYLSTHNIDFDNPAKNGLPYEALERLLDSIRPRKKLLLIDACHSGEVDKDELAIMDKLADSMGLKKRGVKIIGYKKNKQVGLLNSFELMQDLFVNVSRGTGATIISAAGGAQYALERGDLENGVFTYCILQALDRQTSLSVSELKRIVGENVLKLTKGMQKPTSRNETNNFDWLIWE